MRVRPLLVRLGALSIGVAMTAACASTGATSQPVPFPLAPPAGSAEGPATPLPESVVDQIVHTALGLRGTPYTLGGDNPSSGFDCSGLVWYVFEQAHVSLPRTAAEQYLAGRPVPPDQIRAGDLLFFRTTTSGPSHVGIALGSFGEGEFIHAPTENGVVRVERFDTRYWRSRLLGVRRISFPPLARRRDLAHPVQDDPLARAQARVRVSRAVPPRVDDRTREQRRLFGRQVGRRPPEVGL